jgi:hypothetical protein
VRVDVLWVGRRGADWLHILEVVAGARYPRKATMTDLFRSTAQTATQLLAGCSIIWVVSALAQDRGIAWETIGALWMVGWPVLFVGFSVRDLIDRRPH